MIGLAATWNALPRKPLIADATHSFYVDAVRDFLKSEESTIPKCESHASFALIWRAMAKKKS